MNDRIAVQREAVRRSLQLRRSLSIPREHAINVFDVASALGVDVQFLDLPSLEGMFYRGPDPKIILPNLHHRPRGRVVFSCAHEIGHFDLGHGTQVDEYLSSAQRQGRQASLEELAANTFASTLLLPRPAVLARFDCRNQSIDDVSEVGLYQIANELDVGYETLCRHIRFSLELVGDGWLKRCERTAPKAIRELIAPAMNCSRLVILDQHWPMLPVDLEVGDCIAVKIELPIQLPDLLRIESEHDGRRIFRAAKPGNAVGYMDDKSLTIRVSRRGYVGLLRYRYLEEGVEDE